MPERESARVGAADVALVVGVTVLGLVLRLRYFGGFGLADDQIFWFEVKNILVAGRVAADNQAYRFTWWLPTAVAARLLGLSETTFVLPYLVYSFLGVALVYAFAHMLFGRWAAVVAALLVAVHPLDVTWSTLATNDFALSFFAALTMFCVLRALRQDDPIARRRLWAIAGLGLFLSYYSKVSGLFLVPVIGGVVLVHRDRLDGFRWGVCTALLLLGGGALASYALTGSLFAPVQAELRFQGIFDPTTADQREVHLHELMIFPRVLFASNHLGVFLNAFYPHALVGLAVLAWPMRLRTDGALWWWLFVVFAGMELNVQHVGGRWVAAFRNFRHAHIFVYPTVLLLTGYLAALRGRWRRAAAVLTAALLTTAALESVRTATIPHVAFADGREACRFLERTPPGSIYLDPMLQWRCQTLVPAAMARWAVLRLPTDPPARVRVLATPEPGSYVVTGGGREPMYGLTAWIPLGRELPLGSGARPVLERPGPEGTAWRPESLRIWKFPG